MSRKKIAHWIIKDREAHQYIECSHCTSMYCFKKNSNTYYMADAHYCPCCGYRMSEPSVIDQSTPKNYPPGEEWRYFHDAAIEMLAAHSGNM